MFKYDLRLKNPTVFPVCGSLQFRNVRGFTTAFQHLKEMAKIYGFTGLRKKEI